MPVGKEGSHLGQSVDVGSLGLGVPPKTADPVVQIVDRNEQDIGLRTFSCRKKERG